MARRTVKQLAEIHGLSRAIIYVWVEERRFPVLRVGAKGRRGRILIEDEDFMLFLLSQRVEAGPVQVSGPLIHIRAKS
jgi:hypothetical protein